MSTGFSRRYFFYGTLLGGALPLGGFGSTSGSSAPGYKSLTEKLNIACVGLGLRGPQILLGAAASENIVALCDVDDERMERAAQPYPKAARYRDFRQMLDKEGKNIDAVMVATPDHLHAPISLACMQRGKHVYCEKPLTSTIWESTLLADAAAKYKVATQMGNQGFSHEGTKTTCEIVWSGDIGDVREVHAWTSSGGVQPDIPETGLPGEPVPSTLDWNLWLGPAADRPYNSQYSRWRSFQDFSLGGSLGDWLVHILGPAHLALQLGTVSPTSVECVKVEGKNKWAWPLRVHTVFEFPSRGSMPPVTVHVYQNMRGDFQNPAGMKESDRLLPTTNNLAERGRTFIDAGDGVLAVGSQVTIDGKMIPLPPPSGRGGRGPQGAGGAGAGAGGRGAQQPVDPSLRAPGNGSVLVGTKGCLATSGRGEGVWLLPASRWAEYKLPPQLLPRGVNHQQDWIRACKGGVAGISEFPAATKYLEWLALGAIAWRVSGKLQWDAKNLRFANNAEANKYLKPFVRKGWEMKL
ncbi:MAG: Gfo/Idh/MocA family oxidoreductase [Candidatus Solibacter sp.]